MRHIGLPVIVVSLLAFGCGDDEEEVPPEVPVPDALAADASDTDGGTTEITLASGTDAVMRHTTERVAAVTVPGAGTLKGTIAWTEPLPAQLDIYFKYDETKYGQTNCYKPGATTTVQVSDSEHGRWYFYVWNTSSSDATVTYKVTFTPD